MPISEKRWAMVERAGVATLARRHPLDRRRRTIGSFDLAVSRGGEPRQFRSALCRASQRRRARRVADKLKDVSLRVGRTIAAI